MARSHQGMEVKLVGVSLPVHLGHDVLVVVVAQGPAHLVVVHVGLGFSLPPLPGHLVRVSQLELPGSPLPGDEGEVGVVCQELQEELPELYLPRVMGWG